MGIFAVPSPICLEAERPGGRDQTGEELGASVALRQTEEKFRTEVGRIVSGVL
jgi:hypothetical protein